MIFRHINQLNSFKVSEKPIKLLGMTSARLNKKFEENLKFTKVQTSSLNFGLPAQPI